MYDFQPWIGPIVCPCLYSDRTELKLNRRNYYDENLDLQRYLWHGFGWRNAFVVHGCRSASGRRRAESGPGSG
jgi:hypothetical protein